MRISDWSSDVCSSDLFFPVSPEMSPPVCSPRCEGNLAISAAANSSLLRVKKGSGGIGGATGGAGGKGSGGRGSALWAGSDGGAAEARLDVLYGSGVSGIVPVRQSKRLNYRT